MTGTKSNSTVAGNGASGFPRLIKCGLALLLFLFLLFFVQIYREKLNANEVLIEPGSIDLGGVLQNTTQQATFTVRNASPEGINLSVKDKSCSCTTVKIEKTHLGPGESGKVILSIEMGDRVGSYGAAVNLAVQTLSRTSILSATVRFVSERAALVNPSRLDLASVDQDQPIKAAITLQKGERPIDWKKVVAESKVFGPLEVIQIGDRTIVNYSANFQQTPLGRFKDVITLHLLSDGTNPTHYINVPVDAVVTSNMVYSPESLFVSINKPGARIKGSLNVQSSDNKPIKFCFLKSDLNLNFHCKQVKANSFAIEYSIVLPDTEQTIDGHLILDVETDKKRRISIPVVGYVQP